MSHEITENTYAMLKLNSYPGNKAVHIQDLISVAYEIRRHGDKTSIKTQYYEIKIIFVTYSIFYL